MVRVAPDEISCIRSDAWADIYGHRGQRSFTRDFKWYARLTEGQDDIIVSSESDHARFRKAFGASFSDKTLKPKKDVMMRNIQLLVSKLKSHIKVNNGVANMVKWYNFMTFDVIGDLVYGSTFGCLENEEYHPWLGVVLQNIRLSSYGALMERYPIFKWLASVIVPKESYGEAEHARGHHPRKACLAIREKQLTQRRRE
jgi:cytochrome P450